jgi:hypothetical protein
MRDDNSDDNFAGDNAADRGRQEQDLARREAGVGARESACSDREQETFLILDSAERRDRRAKERDVAADRRDFDAALHYAVYGHHEPEPATARRQGRMDRIESKADRRASALDRTRLSAPPVPSVPETTLEEAIAAAVNRIKLKNQRDERTEGA